LSRRINGLLIDEQRIDHAAHLDELLPVAAVAGEARDLPRGHRTNLAEADLCNHPLKARPGHAARGRAAKIIIDNLDL